MDNALKALDYDKEIEAVRGEWYRQHPDGSAIAQPVYDSGGWVVSVRSDSVVVELDNTMYEIAYTKDSEGIVSFASRVDWQEVVREYVPAKNNALKTLSRTDAELRVGNYIVLFGDENTRDLEGYGSKEVNPDGTKGEFFTKRTRLESRFTDAGAPYEDWEHGVGRQIDGGLGPGPDDILGYVDWKTARMDDLGVWVERVLNRRSEYIKFVEELIEEGLISTSSQAVRDGIEKATNGEIQRWPIERDTMTVNPMEFRNAKEFGDNVLTAFKALGIPVPAHTTEPKPKTETEPEADQSAASVVNARARVKLEIYLNNHKEL